VAVFALSAAQCSRSHPRAHSVVYSFNHTSPSAFEPLSGLTPGTPHTDDESDLRRSERRVHREFRQLAAATVPGGAKSGKITVTTAGGTAASSGAFTVKP